MSGPQQFCGQCFAPFPATAPACPRCGASPDRLSERDYREKLLPALESLASGHPAHAIRAAALRATRGEHAPPPAMCPFCGHAEPILQNDLAFAIFDNAPVNPGHMLLLPHRHVATWFEATADERSALLGLLEAGREMLEARYRPDGYNIGINVGDAGGQTVMHLHMHLIPRYHGDCADPRGGVRGVIPARQNY